jgi:hypothetical protein
MLSVRINSNNFQTASSNPARIDSSNFAFLVEVTEDSFVYRIQYFINPVVVARTRATRSEIKITKNLTLNAQLTSSSSFVQQIQNLSATNLTAARLIQSSNTATSQTQVGDITRRLPVNIFNSTRDLELFISQQIDPMTLDLDKTRVGQTSFQILSSVQGAQIEEISVTEIVSLSRSLFENERNLNFELKIFNPTREGSSFFEQTLNQTINHSKQLALYFTPTQIPTTVFGINPTTKQVEISVKQKDKHGIGAVIYKKINYGFNFGKHEFVGKIDNLNFGDDFVKIQDKSSNSDNVKNTNISYKILSIGKDNLVSHSFQSIEKKQEKISANKICFCLSVNQFENGIKINLSKQENWKDTFSLVNLYRKNLSTVQENLELIATFNDDVESFFEIFDENGLQTENVYEYYCVGISRTGIATKQSCSNRTNIWFQSLQTGVVSTFIENVDLSDPKNIVFSIRNQEASQGLSVVDVLNQQGFSLLGMSAQQQQNNTKSIVVNILFRLNLTNGTMEEIGPINQKNDGNIVFNDVDYQKSQGLKPLETGNKYRYLVKTYTRDPSTLLETNQELLLSGTEQSYTIKPFKWHHPNVKIQSTVGTEKTFNKYNAHSIFSFGNLVDIKTIDLNKTVLTPQVNQAGLTITKIFNNFYNITWNCSSQDVVESMVDHFVVNLQAMSFVAGREEIYSEVILLSKIHTINNIGHNFSFNFHLPEPAIKFFRHYPVYALKKFTCFVNPIYFDNTSGVVKQTNSIEI